MTTQHILTISIDAIALSFAAIMLIDFAFTLAAAWAASFGRNSSTQKCLCKSGSHKPHGMCAETLAPIFEDAPDAQEICNESVKLTLVDTVEIPMFTKIEIGGHLGEARRAEDSVRQTSRLSIRELKKQASVAKIKNYSMLTKAQLLEALNLNPGYSPKHPITPQPSLSNH